MADLVTLKNITIDSFRDFRKYFSYTYFYFYLLLFVYFIIEISRVKFVEGASATSIVFFDLATSIILLPISSLVIVDIVLERKAHDLTTERESLFNNTLTFMLTTVVTIFLMALGFVFLVIPGIILFVLLSMAPFISIYEEGEGLYPLKRSVELIGKKKFWMIFAGLILLILIQAIGGVIPYSNNLYLSFFIGIFKAVFFPVNIIFSTFLMINLYQHLREEHLAAIVAREDIV